MTRNKEGLDISARCLPATRFSFDWGAPITKDGMPVQVGYRICGNLDCTQSKHITQSRYIAKKIYGYLPSLKRTFKVVPAPVELLTSLAQPVDRDKTPSKCKVPLCQRKHRALNLCNAHHNQLYRIRLQQGRTARMKRDNSDIDRYVLPPAGNELKAKDRYCHYPECDRGYFARGLCKTHHKRWLRWKQAQLV